MLVQSWVKALLNWQLLTSAKPTIYLVPTAYSLEVEHTKMMTLEELDPLYHFSTHYPDRLSAADQCFTNTISSEKKSSGSRISRRKNNPRYKTQPITFDEIKEVEEPLTPSNENNNISQTNCFLTNLHLENTDMTADARLKPHSRSSSSEMINSDLVGSKDSTENVWYDSPYPAKLSFLDVPETLSTHHYKHTSKPSDKAKFKNRAMRRRNNPRYKTQPITFDEIQEVEEPEVGGSEQSSSTGLDTLVTQNKHEDTTSSLLGCSDKTVVH